MSAALLSALQMEGLEGLARRGIKQTRHGTYPHLISLKYGSSANFDDAVSCACRGIIVDESAGWAVVARPFDKFFNHSETHAAKLDWSTAVAYEKWDGSLILVYWYRDGWQIGTSGSADGEGLVRSHEGRESTVSFRALFLRVLEANGWHLPADDDTTIKAKEFTFMFELVAPENRIVVQYAKPAVVLLGARHTATGAELLPEAAQAQFGFGMPTPERMAPVSAVADLSKVFRSKSPVELEGFVVVDGNFARLKVKHPSYVVMHAFGEDSHMNNRRMIDVVRHGDADEVIAYFPEYAEELQTIRLVFERFVRELQTAWLSAKSLSGRAFITAINASACPDALEAVRRGQCSTVEEYLCSLAPAHLLKLLDLPDTTQRKGKGGRKKVQQQQQQHHHHHQQQQHASSASEEHKHEPRRYGGGKDVTILHRLVHGSADSMDVDVCYLVATMPPMAAARKFCDEDAHRENRNLAVVARGVVVETLKGLTDEVNNALRRTFPLHAENTGVCPIERDVPRNVGAKLTMTLGNLLGLLIHKQEVDKCTRDAVKLALRGDMRTQLACLARLNVQEMLRPLSADARKSFAFKLGQTYGLLRGEEHYTKAEIAAAFPELEPLLYRRDAGARSVARESVQRLVGEFLAAAAAFIARPSSEECKVEAPPTMVIGIDIGGVIIEKSDRSGGEDTSFFGDNFLVTPAVDGAFEAIAAIVKHAGAANVHLVSKASGTTIVKTNQWLEHHDFFGRTGMRTENVVFCARRPDKVAIAARLGLSHFVDDSWGVIQPLLQSDTSSKTLLWFGPQPPRTVQQVTASELSRVQMCTTWQDVLRRLGLATK